MCNNDIIELNCMESYNLVGSICQYCGEIYPSRDVNSICTHENRNFLISLERVILDLINPRMIE